MPSFEVTVRTDEDIQAAIDAEKANYPGYIYPDSPEFRYGGGFTTATVHAQIDPDYVAVEVPEVTESATCVATKLNGDKCGRVLPCRYHFISNRFRK